MIGTPSLDLDRVERGMMAETGPMGGEGEICTGNEGKEVGQGGRSQ